MKKRISFLKKLQLFRFYRKKIKKISFELETTMNARIDGAFRIYTVINIPSELIEEPYNLRKEDIDSLAKTYLRDYSTKLSGFLNSKGLMELYDFYEITKVEKYSYLIVFGFSLFDSAIFMRNFYITTFTLISAILITLTILLL